MCIFNTVIIENVTRTKFVNGGRELVEDQSGSLQ